MPNTAPTSLSREQDPADWCAVIAVFFLALVWHRLGIPSKIYFDEVHYIKAARALLELKRANPEHPLLGKEIIAASIALLGDKPLFWRVPSALLGALGLFAFGRALWFASGSRFAALAGMGLLASDFAWFIQSRIAMLDMFMASFAMIALWMLAAAVRRPEQGRWRLALAGIALGLSIASKWSILPAAMLPGLTFLAMKLKANGRRFLIAKEGGPVRGVSLLEAALWLGLVPLAAYWCTFAPSFYYHDHAIRPLAMIEHHRYMLQLQDSVVKPHPYMSQWYQWLIDWRAVWYLYEVVDGAQRGVVLIGNPVSMLAGLPAVLWALWAGIWRRRYDALACAVLYITCLGMWAVSGKPVQFYYHYLLPGTFLMACLALALDELRRSGWRWVTYGTLAATAAVAIWFYPIISAAQLHDGKQSYAKWMWLRSWR
ncbi:MAG TPA: phospholipid carrier-dependent glycosyltransferase [Novosphingobium sp.]|nr:phospholipid carrier-dependent glycosyltransferase [Novosphingobium sp.]